MEHSVQMTEDSVDMPNVAGAQAASDEAASTAVPARHAEPVLAGATRQTVLSGVDVAEFIATSERATYSIPAPDEPRLRVLVVRAGAAVVTSIDTESVPAGDAVLLPAVGPGALVELQPGSRVLVLTGTAPEVQSTLVRSPRRIVGATAPDRAAAVLMVIADEVLDDVERQRGGPAVRALPPLFLAVLEQELEVDLAVAPTMTLRDRVLDHIAHHLNDPTLSPRSIALALGVSLRWVHRAFDGEPESIAKSIRRRRVDEVAVRLSTADPIPRGAELAEEIGFTSRDHLARSFMALRGVTLAEFARRHATGGVSGAI